MQSMSLQQTQYRSAAALLLVAAFMHAGARRLHAAAKWLEVWLERRRLAAAAFHDFEAMGERELHDIGLTRADLHRVAWGGTGRLEEQV